MMMMIDAANGGQDGDVGPTFRRSSESFSK